MAFEIAIKATQREIERLEKRKQAIQDNIDAYHNRHELREKRARSFMREGKLMGIIELHESKLVKQTPKKLSSVKAELATVKKETARILKIFDLNFLKEADKQMDIDLKIDDLRLELIKLNNLAALY